VTDFTTQELKDIAYVVKGFQSMGEIRTKLKYELDRRACLEKRDQNIILSHKV
jgi:hypothetical protein